MHGSIAARLERQIQQGKNDGEATDQFTNGSELFKRHVWINPFWEDDVNEVAHYMGTDRVIFGSDWPHIEGLPAPLDYVGELDRFDEGQKQQIMRDNARLLNTPQPA